MRNIISGEIYKLCKSKYFYIGLALTSGIIIMVFALTRVMAIYMTDVPDVTPKNALDIIAFIYPECKLSILLAFMSCLLVNNDIRTKTINIMISASTRHKIYLAKLCMGFILSFSIIFVVLVTAIVIGMLFLGDFSFIGSNILFFIHFLISHTFISFATCSIAIMLAFMVKKVTVAIPVCVLCEFVIVGIADGLSFINKAFANIDTFIPAQMITIFTLPEHFYENNIILYMLVCAGIIILTSAFGIFAFKKTDF
ncbi:hypothetical protein FACS1894106_5870 [Spirochaetia bacterium]|nr:hypothetical protein FACS1894106_5870 [Spirochaetia bacterium]